MQANESQAVPGSRTRRVPFLGTLIAALLLVGVEAILHADAFLYRYRSVFAAGRAMDKLLALEARPATVLAVGNSHVDNGFSPAVFVREAGLSAFNLGLPGAEACNIEGVIGRLADRQLFGKGRIEQVLFGLDDLYFRRVGGLGYEVFFDEPGRLLEQGRYLDWLRSKIRLWGYADSLRSLQEPAKLVGFAKATVGQVESWGGNARDTAGFRAADAFANQDDAQLRVPTAQEPPDAQVLECFRATVERLQRAGVEVSVFFLPTLRGANAFSGSAAGAFGALKAELAAQGVRLLEIDSTDLVAAEYFANPGHLNQRGAALFTQRLSARLASADMRAADIP